MIVLYIGESINSTRKSVNEAVVEHDQAFIVELAKEQVAAGANVLDVNAGTGKGSDEAEDLVWLVELVQKNIDVPLCLDSSDPRALEAAIKVHHGVPFINSISGEKSKRAALLPVIASTPCKVIALCLGDNGIPTTAEERLSIARVVVGELEQSGVKREDIYLDPIVMSVATTQGAGKVTLDTISLLKKELPGVKTVLAVSNVGFGLPVRGTLNSYFTAMAVEKGLDALLADVRNKAIMASVLTAEALLGKDNFCLKYLKGVRKGIIS